MSPKPESNSGNKDSSLSFLDVTQHSLRGTPASRDFFLAFEGINRFARYVIGMASQIEHMAHVARDALIDVSGDDEERAKLEAEKSEWTGPMVHLAAHRQFFIETLLCRHVENYLNYLSALLFEIFVQRPETMRSGEKLDLEFVLGHDSMDSLVKGIAERKVGELSYRSFDRLIEFFEERFKVDVCPESDRNTVNEAIETRNISVHNRCRVNQRYVEKTKKRENKLGEIRHLGAKTLDLIAPVFVNAVTNADAIAVDKLKLSAVDFAIPELLQEEFEKERQALEKNIDGTPGSVQL